MILRWLTGNQHLGNRRGFSVAFPNGFSVAFSNELSLFNCISKGLSLSQWIFTGVVHWTFSGIFQRIFTFVISGVIYIYIYICSDSWSPRRGPLAHHRLLLGRSASLGCGQMSGWYGSRFTRWIILEEFITNILFQMMFNLASGSGNGVNTNGAAAKVGVLTDWWKRDALAIFSPARATHHVRCFGLGFHLTWKVKGEWESRRALYRWEWFCFTAIMFMSNRRRDNHRPTEGVR